MPGRATKQEPAIPAGPLTVVHIEDQPSCRDAVRAVVSRQPGTHYVCPQFPPAGTIRSSTLLAINLLCRHLDPLSVVAEAEKWGVHEPRAFTYCADGARTVVLGLVEYFPFPFDADACAARLFERPQETRRILTVSDHIELMTRLRMILSGGRCSTTMALDRRQALDLVKPVNPDIILDRHGAAARRRVGRGQSAAQRSGHCRHPPWVSVDTEAGPRHFPSIRGPPATGLAW